MTRLLTNPRFWVLAFVLTWLTVVTVLIAMGQAADPNGAGAPR